MDGWLPHERPDKESSLATPATRLRGGLHSAVPAFCCHPIVLSLGTSFILPTTNNLATGEEREFSSGLIPPSD